MSKYTDPADNFKLNDASHPMIDDEQFKHMLLIFNICYKLTEAPDGSLEWVEDLYLSGEFSRLGPVKLYDRWLAKRMAPTEDKIEELIRKYQRQRQSLFTWQESGKGLLVVDGKLIWDSETDERYYIYEFPFLVLVQRVWDLCPIGLSIPRVKSIARREFNKMYPERGNQPKTKHKQDPKHKVKRAISTLLSLLSEYNSEHGDKAGPICFEADIEEILEDKGNPLIIKLPES